MTRSTNQAHAVFRPGKLYEVEAGWTPWSHAPAEPASNLDQSSTYELYAAGGPKVPNLQTVAADRSGVHPDNRFRGALFRFARESKPDSVKKGFNDAKTAWEESGSSAGTVTWHPGASRRIQQSKRAAAVLETIPEAEPHQLERMPGDRLSWRVLPDHHPGETSPVRPPQWRRPPATRFRMRRYGA